MKHGQILINNSLYSNWLELFLRWLYSSVSKKRNECSIVVKHFSILPSSITNQRHKTLKPIYNLVPSFVRVFYGGIVHWLIVVHKSTFKIQQKIFISFAFKCCVWKNRMSCLESVNLYDEAQWILYFNSDDNQSFKLFWCYHWGDGWPSVVNI